MGRLRLPRRATTLRTLLVAVLLVTAAGVLHSGSSGPNGDRAGAADPSPTVPAATPGVAGAGAAGSGVAGSGVAGNGQPPVAPESGWPDRVPVPAGMVGVTVALPEPGALAMLRPGDQVDLLALPAGGGTPIPVAQEVTVLALDPGSATALLSLPPERAAEVLSAPAGERFALVVRP